MAKYDKVGKTLTVTMPVQAPVQPDNAGNTGNSIISAVNDQSEGAIMDDNSGSSSSSSSNEKNEKKAVVVGDDAEKKKKSNARWVGEEDGLREESRLRSEELKREIEAHVIESRQMPSVSSGLSVQPKNAVPSAGKTVTFDMKTASPPSSSSCSSADGSYILSPTFLGKKEGFAFKKGPQGQGYYCDKQSTAALPTPPASAAPDTRTDSSPSITPPAVPLSVTPSSPSPSSVPSSSPSGQYKTCPFEYRQTKQAISVLIHVPRILLDSAAVSFSDRSVTVTFKADRGSDSRSGTSDFKAGSDLGEDVHVNPIVSSSPITGRITSDNTMANSCPVSTVNNGKNGSSSSHNDGNTVSNGIIDEYGFELKLSGVIEKSKCKFDIASQNMVLVLVKDQGGYWEELEGTLIISMVALAEGVSYHLNLSCFYFYLCFY